MNNLVHELEALGKSLPKVDLSKIGEVKELAQTDLKETHYFSFGVYARQIDIPKGAVIVGKTHKFENLNMLVKGEVSVLIDNEIVRLTAPYTFVSKAGSKRVFFSHEDSVWVTIHGTHERDLDIIEDQFIAQTEQEYIDFVKQNRLPGI